MLTCSALMLALATFVQDPKAGAVTVTRADGGSVVTQLGHDIAVNKGSTLRREWTALHDPRMPVDFVGTPGAETVYIPSQYSGDYHYKAKYMLRSSEALSAFEVRFIVFDVWGEHLRTLCMTQVEDVPAKDQMFEGEWQLWTENECSNYYASIAYVARVRTKAGKIIEADSKAVVDQIRSFSAKFTAADLEETKKQ